MKLSFIGLSHDTRICRSTNAYVYQEEIYAL